MQHLSLEVLARLVDEPAEPCEAEHLGCCLVCRRELNALREQTAALSSLADPQPAPGAWESLETALLGEGLIRAAAPASASAPRRRAWPPALRIAASIAIFALGAASGATLLRRSGPPPQAPRGIATLPRPVAEPAAPLALTGPVPTAPTTPTGSAARAADAPAVEAGTAAPLVSGAPAHSAAARATPPATLAAVGAPARTAPGSGPRLAVSRAPRPAADSPAARELAEAEAAYVAALRRYAELADPSSGADPVTRLAALEMLVETTRRALDRAPGDSILNGYHLAALDERDQLRRKFAVASQSTWF